jgi:DNA-binding NtrC family response regulator
VKSEQGKTILLMAGSADTMRLYKIMLEPRDYVLQTCADMTNILELIYIHRPHLIIWHLNPMLVDATLRILAKIKQSCGRSKYPFVLLSVPTDWFSSTRLTSVVDEVVEFLVDPNHFLVWWRACCTRRICNLIGIGWVEV